MSGNTHDCPGGCGRTVVYEHLACRTCWYRLPAGFRARVWSSWRARADNPHAHLDAVTDACRWYDTHRAPSCP